MYSSLKRCLLFVLLALLFHSRAVSSPTEIVDGPRLSVSSEQEHNLLKLSELLASFDDPTASQLIFAYHQAQETAKKGDHKAYIAAHAECVTLFEQLSPAISKNVQAFLASHSPSQGQPLLGGGCSVNCTNGSCSCVGAGSCSCIAGNPFCNCGGGSVPALPTWGVAALISCLALLGTALLSRRS